MRRWRGTRGLDPQPDLPLLGKEPCGGRPRFLAVVILSAGAIVAGCTPAPTPVAGYRAADARISSLAAVDAARLSGTWVVVDGYEGAGLGAPGSVLHVTTAGDDLVMRARRDDGASQTLRFRRIAPGRFEAAGAPMALWLLWADDGYRVAAMGNPDGSIGFVMLKQGARGSGLRQAAREILLWNGYDATGLVSVSR